MKTSNVSISKIRTPGGSSAWVATGYETVKMLLSTRKLGRSHPDPDIAPTYSESTTFGRPWGKAVDEHREHARLRSILAPAFTPKAMKTLAPYVRNTVDVALKNLQSLKSPADFHKNVAFPLSSRVISKLIGIPTQDSPLINGWTLDWGNMVDDATARSGKDALLQYITDKVAHKLSRPADDFMSQLLRMKIEGRLLAPEEVASICATLVFAGHQTTVSSIDKGIMVLLGNPSARDLLWSDVSLAASATEEVLRSRNPLPRDPAHDQIGLIRYAHEPVSIEGITIQPGDLVILKKPEANQDARIFCDPDRIDITRAPNPHLAFGHGQRYCPGAPLARLELSILFEMLPQKFPNMRLTRPVEKIERQIGQLSAMPRDLYVTW